jgi:hypothetical protein
VRVGIHTGEAQLREGDYYGTAVNKCARLRAIAHGGQSLLSAATCHLVQDSVPAGVRLRDLGFHRLKDLQRPEQVYQILHSELPADFPPLNSLDNLPNNLPIQLTRFIGREAETGEVKQRLATRALVTLTGAGGCGKTRVALQVAADLLQEYPESSATESRSVRRSVKRRSLPPGRPGRSSAWTNLQPASSKTRVCRCHVGTCSWRHRHDGGVPTGTSTTAHLP